MALIANNNIDRNSQNKSIVFHIKAPQAEFGQPVPFSTLSSQQNTFKLKISQENFRAWEEKFAKLLSKVTSNQRLVGEQNKAQERKTFSCLFEKSIKVQD